MVLNADIIALATHYGRYGYRRITAMQPEARSYLRRLLGEVAA